MKNTEFECREKDNQLFIKVIGDISAMTAFPNVTIKPNQKVTVVLQDAGYVNSSGIQGWITWLGSLKKKSASTKFHFQLLPANFARCAFQIRDFLPEDSVVESFVTPYFCGGCEKSFHQVFTKGANWNPKWTAEETIKNISKVKCPTCGVPAEIDAVPEVFGKL